MPQESGLQHFPFLELGVGKEEKEEKDKKERGTKNNIKPRDPYQLSGYSTGNLGHYVAFCSTVKLINSVKLFFL